MHTILVLVLAAVAGCASAAEANPPAAPLAPAGTVTLSDAVARGLLTFEARGGGTREVRLALHARADLEVEIPAGTFFEATAGVQNMVVTRSTTARLRANTSVTVDLATACASYHRPVPRASDAFALGTAPPGLEALVTCLEHRHIPDSRRQLLVWQVTDGVRRDDVARRPDLIRPYLVEACTTKLHRSHERCTKLVDRAFDLVLERWLASEHESERTCLRAYERANSLSSARRIGPALRGG